MNGKPARQRYRRAAVGAAALVAAVLAAALLIPGARDRLPVGLPVAGRNADTVFDQLKRAGLPVADGVPKAENFQEMVRSNNCKSSRSFVRSDTEDSGWGFICVKPPGDAYRRMSEGFDDVPMLIGPLFVDDNDGEVVIFGFGWPVDASKTIYDAIKGSGGTYLVEQ